MDATATLDSTTWAALALVLTLIGAGLTWFAWRRRGPAAAVRALAWTLVPLAAWLTGTLRLAAAVVDAVVDWATRLVFSPTVWLGIAVAALAVALWLLSGLMRARGIGVRPRSERRAEKQAAKAGAAGGTLTAAGASSAPPASRSRGKGGGGKGGKDGLEDIEDLDDIEAILKRHGI